MITQHPRDQIMIFFFFSFDHSHYGEMAEVRSILETVDYNPWSLDNLWINFKTYMRRNEKLRVLSSTLDYLKTPIYIFKANRYIRYIDIYMESMNTV